VPEGSGVAGAGSAESGAGTDWLQDRAVLGQPLGLWGVIARAKINRVEKGHTL